MRTFNIPQDYYCMKEILYKNPKIKFQEGLSVLVGCNGSGKTTLLRFLKEKLKENDIPVIDFDNLFDGGENARSSAGFNGDMNFVIQASLSSEGENIMMNIGNFAQKIGAFVREHKSSNEIWVLLDAVDSGLSIDNILTLKDLFNLIIKDCERNNTTAYIICSANEYELCRNENCFDVYNGKYIKFNDYEEYRDFIIKSKEIKDIRYH